MRSGEWRGSRLISCSAAIRADQLLSQSEPRNCEAKDAGGFSRRSKASDHGADVAEPDQHRGCTRDGMEQVECGD